MLNDVAVTYRYDGQTKDYIKPKNSLIRDSLLEFMRDTGKGTDLSIEGLSFFYSGRLVNEEGFLRDNPTFEELVRHKDYAKFDVMDTRETIGGKI